MDADDKIMHACDGVTAFLKEMRPDDEVALIAFGDSVDRLGDGFGPRRVRGLVSVRCKCEESRWHEVC